MPGPGTIDIIIPTYRPGEKFIRLLSMLQMQTVPYHSLTVVNTEEALMPKEVREMLSRMDRVRLSHIFREEFDHGGTRRAAAAGLSGEFFVCMTDDAVPADEHLLEELRKGFADPGTAIVYGRQLAEEDTEEAERFTRTFNYPDESMTKTIRDLDRLGIKTYFASNVCCAYRREVYEALGGFPASAIFNEDMIFAAGALKAGWAIRYQADARVIHAHNYSALQQLHRNFDLGMSQAMHPEVFAGIRSEGEGIRLVRETAAHLRRSGHGAEIPRLVIRSGCKYLGFRLGRAWEKLPEGLVRSLAMNKTYIDRLYQNRQEERRS